MALLLAMVLSQSRALAIPEAVRRGSTLFAVTYAGVRFLHLALLRGRVAARQCSWSAIAGFAVTVVIGMALLIAACSRRPAAHRAVDGGAGIDYAGPAWLTRERLRGLQRSRWPTSRTLQLFIIICLGESIAPIGLGASGRPLDTESWQRSRSGCSSRIGLWWTYSTARATAEERLRHTRIRPGRRGRPTAYLHLLLVAGIIISPSARSSRSRCGRAAQ